jgi:hypothetical protein
VTYCRKPVATTSQTSTGGQYVTSRVPNEPVKNNKH